MEPQNTNSSHDSDSDGKEEPLSVARKSSFVSSVAKAASNQIHLGLLREDDGPDIRHVNEYDGKSFYVPRHKLPKRKQVRLLFEGARDDVRDRRVFSPYDVQRVLNYFDGAISFVSVFLYEELGWAKTLDVGGDPRPVLLSLLCFFHVMVYWLNTHHFLKFSPDVVNLPQVWCMILFTLGLVLYPLSLGAWIETGESETYYFINTGCCFVLTIFNWITKVDTEKANALYVLHQRSGPALGTLVYGIATILKCVVKWEGSDYIMYITPFTFVLPLGAQRTGSEIYHGDAALSLRNILPRAWSDIKSGNIFSPYPIDIALDYFDAVVGLATVLVFLELGWQDTIAGDNANGLLAGILCYIHVLGYWLNIHHNLKFSPQRMSVLQVWCVVFFALGVVFYPLSIQAWISEGSVDVYYVVNLCLSAFFVVFSFLTYVEPGRSTLLYRFMHKVGPITSFIWYLIAFSLLRSGHEQRWMIIAGPFIALFPIGGEKEQLQSSIADKKDDPSAHSRRAMPANDDAVGGNNHFLEDSLSQKDSDHFYECHSDESKEEEQAAVVRKVRFG